MAMYKISIPCNESKIFPGVECEVLVEAIFPESDKEAAVTKLRDAFFTHYYGHKNPSREVIGMSEEQFKTIIDSKVTEEYIDHKVREHPSFQKKM